MNRYKIAPLAKDDLDAIWDRIGIRDDKPDAARRQIEVLFDKFSLLAKQPLLGQTRDDLRSGLRSFTAGSYVILYYPATDGISVVGVIHAARDIGSMFLRGER